MANFLDNIANKLNSFKTESMTDRFILLMIGFSYGYLIGNFRSFGMFDKKNWFNMFINTKKLIYNFERKTFYVDGYISSKLVDEFQKFMLDVKENEEIDIVIESNGGSFCCAQMMSGMILSRSGVTNAVVLNKAFSAGSLIALSCTNLYMHKNAHLSPVDVQQANFFKVVQLSSVKSIIENKSKDKISDDTFILADQADKCKNLLNLLFEKIIVPRYDCPETTDKIKRELFDGNKNIHGTAFSYEELKKMGIKILDITPTMINKAKCKPIVNRTMFDYDEE